MIRYRTEYSISPSCATKRDKKVRGFSHDVRYWRRLFRLGRYLVVVLDEWVIWPSFRPDTRQAQAAAPTAQNITI